MRTPPGLLSCRTRCLKCKLSLAFFYSKIQTHETPYDTIDLLLGELAFRYKSLTLLNERPRHTSEDERKQHVVK